MSDPNSKEQVSLEYRVCEWLSGEGYRLEYVTYQALRDAGLRATMAQHYATPEGKYREIDVTAFEERQAKTGANAIVRLFAECKYTTGRPWLLLHSGLMSGFLPDWQSIPKSPRLRELFPHFRPHQETLQQCWHLPKKEHVAHNLVEAFRKDNRDLAFNSLQKIANAAWDYTETVQPTEHEVHIVAVPCLVVDGPLLRCWYDYKSERFVAQRVQCDRLSWSGCRGGTLVDVVQMESLVDYANCVKNTFTIFLDVITTVEDRFTA